MKILLRAVVGALACCALAGAATSQRDTRTLAVQGRSNETPSIAATGRFVAVAWSARAASGATDVYAASSRDAGLTFSAPVRVNDAAAPASVSGEQPPRVALVTRAAGDPSTVVVWTTKSSSGTQLVTARSDDGAKTFARSQVLPGADASGNRGWESIITTRDGQVAAVWLD